MRSVSLRATLVLLSAAVIAGACAPAVASGERGGDRNLITQAQIEQSGERDAYDVVRALRPQWFRTRGRDSFTNPSEVRVYVDGTFLGGTDALVGIPSDAIRDIRYFSATQATQRWGIDHGSGAIEVRTGAR